MPYSVISQGRRAEIIKIILSNNNIMKAGVIIFFTILTVASCSLKRFLDCNGGFECPEVASPVCGSDGQTYASQCHMDMENKKRICWIGHYNMVMKVKDGSCDDHTTTPTVH